MCIARIDDVSKLSSENVWSVNEPIDTATITLKGLQQTQGSYQIGKEWDFLTSLFPPIHLGCIGKKEINCNFVYARSNFYYLKQ